MSIIGDCTIGHVFRNKVEYLETIGLFILARNLAKIGRSYNFGKKIQDDGDS